MKPLEQYRELFPVTQRLAYLNHAGVAPVSRPVAEAMEAATRECLEWGALRYERLHQGVKAARENAAKLLEVRPDQVAFVKNTSEGISMVAQGFPWKPGDVVVVPEGEFPANVYPWLHLRSKGVETIRVPMRRGRLALDDFRTCLDTPGVRMLAVSSVEFETGFANDLAALGQMCHERGLFFFVDAIQSLGWTPLHPERYGVGALAADGHKWLMGPEGAGILYLSEAANGLLEPTEVGWNSVKQPLNFSHIHYELRNDATRFECGSYPVVLLHGLGAALELLLEVGLERIRERTLTLSDRIAGEVEKWGIRLLSSREPGEKSPIVSLECALEPAGLATALARENVFVAARGSGLRVSPHFYNDENDIERFFHVLNEEVLRDGGLPEGEGV